MPLSLSRYETGKIMSGEADGVTRMYKSGCPHVVGNKISITSKFTDGQGRDEPFAVAQIKSIRPATVHERSKNDKLANMDGFANGAAWKAHFEKLYGEQHGDTVVHRLQLVILEAEKK